MVHYFQHNANANVHLSNMAAETKIKWKAELNSRDANQKTKEFEFSSTNLPSHKALSPAYF